MKTFICAVGLAVACGWGWTALQPRPDGEGEGALTFEVYKDARSEFRWRLKAANGRLIAMSDEGYTTKASCKRGIEIIKEGAAQAKVEDLVDSE